MKRTNLLLCALGLAGFAGLPVRGADVETPGFLKYESWFSPLRNPALTGTDIGTLMSDPNYPNTPDMVSYAAGMTSRPVFPDDTHDQYGARLTGWFTPTVTGDYNFYLRSDDASQLWISTDANLVNILEVAEEPGCCNAFIDPPASQTTATPIHMLAGQKYAVQILLKEGGGGDFVEVACQSSTSTIPAASLTPLKSTMISSTASPTGASVSITQQPANTSTPENTAVTFSVAATAVTPFAQYTAGAYPDPTNSLATVLGTKQQLATFYQWFTNGVEAVGENGATYSITWPKKAHDGMKVKCYVAVPGVPTYSSEATLTVTADTTPPAVISVIPDLTFTALTIKYSEPVSDTALTPSDYALNNGVAVSSVARVDLQTVKLTTSKMADSQTYTLTINGVQDTATPGNSIAANTQVQIKTYVFMAGTILHQKYNNVTDGNGWPLSNLFNDPRYPNSADRRDLATMWEYPANGSGRNLAADPVRNYWDTIEGFFIPPTSGNYVFFTCGADRFQLYLSTDDTPANRKLIAQINGWTNPRNWVTGQSTDMTPGRSDTYANTEWPQGNTITLTAGQRYYMLEIHHDPSWCGADDFAATYKLASDPDPLDGDAPKLTGSVVGFYFDPTGAKIDYTVQPTNTTVVEGNAATLYAAATGSSVYGNAVLYQWQSAPKSSSTWSTIANANGATYKTPLLSQTDDGTQYRLIASVPPISSTSSVAVVSVLKDTIPPVPTVGAMLDATAGTVDVGVAFDEPVDNTSASLLANYSVSPGTITSIEVYTNRFTANSQNPLVMGVKHSILLKVTGLSGSGTLTIKNVADAHGNPITSVSLPFTVDTKMKWGAVGANELGLANAVVPVTANGFDVYSDGIGEWGTYDEATFVYEQVTGDFDKKVRVEYQDGSSEWARAGIIVRDVTEFGVDRNTQATSAGRYQKCHVNPVGPVLTGPGTPGNASWEGNRRLDTGAATTSAGGGGQPQYPSAWCRIQRAGQKFTIYRSDDGVNWVTLGATTWGVDDASKTPMPDTVYVGPEFTPENGNVTQAPDQGTFLARFRDYGNYVATFDPQLKVGMDASGKMTISWATGTLVSCPTAQGPWSTVTGAVSPYSFTPPKSGAMYYRVKQ